MFVGIDHGTTAMRFVGIADDGIKKFELLRSDAAVMSEPEIIDLILHHFDVDKSEISKEIQILDAKPLKAEHGTKEDVFYAQPLVSRQP